MHIVYSERLKQAPEEYAVARGGTNRLEEVSASAKGLPYDVSGEWDRQVDDAGQSSLTLRLRKSDGDSVVGTIPADEWRTPWLTAYRVYRLWSDLFSASLDRRIARMMSEN